MSSYDVYGIGNALVDIEYRVSPGDLEARAIDKGVMTLVEAERQAGLMSELEDRHVHRSAGGSAANTVIALSQFGGRGYYSCKIGDDALGHLYAKDLQANGVATNAHDGSEPGDTGRCLVLVTPDADRTMLTYLGITGGLARGEVDTEALRAASWLYIEGYLATSDSARDAVVHARELAADSGVRTAISLSDPTIVTHFRSGLLEMIGSGVDLVFANEEEALGLTGGESLEGALEKLKPMATNFVVTRGAQPAVAWDGREIVEIPSHPVTPLDTVGAGDMFAGAFLYGITRGWAHARAGELASAACARLIRTYGPRLPAEESQRIRDELES